eukprot:314901-Rhodomonas_salina.1
MRCPVLTYAILLPVLVVSTGGTVIWAEVPYTLLRPMALCNCYAKPGTDTVRCSQGGRARVVPLLSISGSTNSEMAGTQVGVWWYEGGGTQCACCGTRAVYGLSDGWY